MREYQSCKVQLPRMLYKECSYIEEGEYRGTLGKEFEMQHR